MNIETLLGSNQTDTFSFGTGLYGGDFSLVGNDGADTAEIAGNVDVGGNMSIFGVESVIRIGDSTLSAGQLTIDGASTGIGTFADNLQTDVDSLEVANSGDVFIDELDGIEIVSVNSTGEVSIDAGAGIVLGLIDADGDISLIAATGNITNGNGALEPNIIVPVGSMASLAALAGGIGANSQPITFVVPLVQGQATINLVSIASPVIDNTLDATVGSSLPFIDVNAQRDAAVGASILSAIEEIGFVDWAGLDPDVRLVDCLEPCIKLPADQLEDEELAWLREPTQMLMIRTVNGVKLIPIFSETIASNHSLLD